MESLKHTPGPWIRSLRGFQVLTNERDISICQLDGRQPQETQIANAALISAAPELLQFAIEMVE